MYLAASIFAKDVRAAQFS